MGGADKSDFRIDHGGALDQLLTELLAVLMRSGVVRLKADDPNLDALLELHAMISREQVVDREAVRLTGSRRAYLEALRTVACRSRQPEATLAVGDRGGRRSSR